MKLGQRILKKEMTIGEKLRLINGFLLFIPMLFTLICITIIYLTFITGDMKYIVNDMQLSGSTDNAYACCEYLFNEYEKLLVEKDDENPLSMVPSNYDSNKNIYVEIYRDEDLIFGSKEHIKPSNYKDLIGYVSNSNEKQFLVIDDKFVFKGTIIHNNNTYTIYASGQPNSIVINQRTSWFYYSVLTTNIFFIIIVSIAVHLMSKFFYKSIFKRVDFSLKTITQGVESVSSGNLDYKINYEINDEFKPVCDKFNSMTNKLKESVELILKQENIRKEIIMSISHDIFSPLTSIKAYCEGIENGIASTEEAKKKYLEVIKSKANQIESIVSQLLFYSKLEYEDFAPNNEKVNLGEFLNNYVKYVDVDYTLKNIQVSIEKSDKSTVYADKTLLSRLLTNIIDNSGKYSNKPVSHVSISLTKKENSCVVSISDDGPGIPSDSIEHIFEVFYRSDSARNKTSMGSGIGLSIVNNIVTKALHGTIRAQNIPSGGLEMIIEIPTITEE